MTSPVLLFLLSLCIGHVNNYQNTTTAVQGCRNRWHNHDCELLPVACMTCVYNTTCVYGGETDGNCSVHKGIECLGNRVFVKKVPCRFCYQLPKDQYRCQPRAFCQTHSTGLERLVVNCTVAPKVHCLGNRVFKKSFKCNWTSGYRWSTAFILSITLGGFGADRFYLGHWEEGLGKFFSFGGLGAWTLVDIVLVGVGYVKPQDGSMYIF